MPHLEKSLAAYRQLTGLTKERYLYANSMQTQQRKIPMRGVDGTYKTWVEMLPVFEKEVVVFQQKIDSIKLLQASATNIKMKPIQMLKNSDVKFTSHDTTTVYIATDIHLFNDTSVTVVEYAKELKGLKCMVLSAAKQKNQGTVIHFTNDQPIKVLVGFFNTKQSGFLKAPELETNASANDYGQAETKIANGIVLKGMPSVNIHTYSFKPGINKLVLAKGICLVLGFVAENDILHVYDAGLNEAGNRKEIDWLFE